MPASSDSAALNEEPGAAGAPSPLRAATDIPGERPRVVVVMPAYNAARTLRMTYAALPRDAVDLVILVDDGSTDDTVAIARQLDLKVFLHDRNYGYGANQKTCYAEALKAGADIVVMVHPDYQYDPRLLPEIIRPIQQHTADVVLGSRLADGTAQTFAGGMPWWKLLSNRLLTWVENRALGLHLSEYHTGYRAYRREVLETVNLSRNADRFIFDQEILVQIVAAGFRISEVAVPTRYFAEASTVGFFTSVRYGLDILRLMARYQAHHWGWLPQRQFQSLRHRYRAVE
jgi:glycosyltransferase involved in cell wall biosynthesis